VETSVERLEDTRVNVKLEFTSQEMRSAFGKVYSELSKQVLVPGFRPGKAPRILLERVLGKEAVRAQVVQELVPDRLASVIEERKLFVVGEPDITYDPPESDQPFLVTAGLAVVPDPEVGDLSAISIVRPQVFLSDDETDRIIEGLRESASRSVEVTDRPIELADFVRLHYQITCDEEELYDPNDLPMMYLEVGAEWYVPVIDNDLVGLTTEDTKDIAVEYPEDYENARLAGKTATFRVKIESVSRRELPELDEAFLESWNVTDLEGLKRRIRDERLTDISEVTKDVVEQQALAGLIRSCTMQLPDLLITTQADDLSRAFVKRLKDEEGLTLREYIDRAGIEFSDYRRDLERQAERVLRRAFAVEAVAKQRGIEVPDEDLEEPVWTLARSARMSFSEMWDMLKESGTLEEMRERKRQDKVVELILAEAQVTDREMSFQEFASNEWRPTPEPEPEADSAPEAEVRDEAEAGASEPGGLDDVPHPAPLPEEEGEATPLPPGEVAPEGSEGAGEGPSLRAAPGSGQTDSVASTLPGLDGPDPAPLLGGEGQDDDQPSATA